VPEDPPELAFVEEPNSKWGVGGEPIAPGIYVVVKVNNPIA
jgi:hypothetical protein